MRLDQLHHVVGIGYDDVQVHTVELMRRWGRVKVLSHGSEPLEGAGPEAVAEAVGRLLRRLGSKAEWIAIHIPPSQERFCTVRLEEGPSGDSTSAMYRQIAKTLMLPVPQEELAISTPARWEDDALVGYGPRASVEAFLGTLEGAGVQPVLLGSAHVDYVYSQLFEDWFWEGRTLICLPLGDADRGCSVSQGVPVMTASMCHTDETRLDERCRLLRNALGNGSIDTLVALTVDTLSSLPGRSALPLAGLGQNLPASHALAAGLAVRALFPDMQGIDYLPDDRRGGVRDRVFKRRSLRFILSLGGLFLSLYLGLILFRVWMVHADEKVEARLYSVMDQSVALERLERRNRQLIQALENTGQLEKFRSQVGGVLDALAQARAGDLWLDRVALGDNNRGKTKDRGPDADLVLSGWAKRESDVAAFLWQLERGSVFTHSRLLRSAQVDRSLLKRKLGFDPGREYIQFTLCTDLIHEDR